MSRRIFLAGAAAWFLSPQIGKLEEGTLRDNEEYALTPTERLVLRAYALQSLH